MHYIKELITEKIKPVTLELRVAKDIGLSVSQSVSWLTQIMVKNNRHLLKTFQIAFKAYQDTR